VAGIGRSRKMVTPDATLTSSSSTWWKLRWLKRSQLASECFSDFPWYVFEYYGLYFEYFWA
jgi:hypothetical protein